jgi:pyruvate formate lyase activating enzyme
MIFGGFQKTSLIDYPGTVSCVIFLAGCNLACPYCHNPELVRGEGPFPSFLHQEWVIDFLKKRVGLLDGVVITGGEPTLSRDLFSLCSKVKELGFKVKLDTNGTSPDVIRQLIEGQVVDYLAMDIKTDPLSYSPVFSRALVSDRILESIRILMDSGLPYEFRTTCVKPLFDEDILKAMLQQIKGARQYTLQRFHFTKILNPSFFENRNCGFTENEFQTFQMIASQYVQECIVR